jgi:hypothetical protein
MNEWAIGADIREHKDVVMKCVYKGAVKERIT